MGTVAVNLGKIEAEEFTKHKYHSPSIFFSIQRISTLEAELADSREELLSVRALQKRQLAEVSLHREEERQRAQRDKEESLSRLRSDMESSRRHLERSHQQQRAAAQEKVREGVLNRIPSIASVVKQLKWHFHWLIKRKVLVLFSCEAHRARGDSFQPVAVRRCFMLLF